MRALSVALSVLAVAFAGCLAPTEEVSPAADVAAAADPVVGPITDEFDGDIMLSFATPVRSFNNGGTFVPTTIEPEADVTGYVLELEWTASTPASQRLSLWVRETGLGTVPPNEPGDLARGAEPAARADGGSPLRLVVPADLLEEGKEYDLIVRASAEPAGAAANQAFTLHVTTFAGVPLDESYSALGDHGHVDGSQ